MAKPVKLADITAMTIDERIALVQAIWDSIIGEADPVDLTDPQKRGLDRRTAGLDANPQNVLTWEQIKAQSRAAIDK